MLHFPTRLAEFLFYTVYVSLAAQDQYLHIPFVVGNIKIDSDTISSRTSENMTTPAEKSNGTRQARTTEVNSTGIMPRVDKVVKNGLRTA